jgi:CO/xanthine dehydrogenase Mo-binding subunit
LPVGDGGGAAAQFARHYIVVEVALCELARMLGLDPAVVRQRYRVLGWSLERALGLQGAVRTG